MEKLYEQKEYPTYTVGELRLPRQYVYFSHIAALIGIPFILIFVPETKDINLYESEGSTKSLGVSMLPEEDTEYAITEEEDDYP